jgi:16S rRNA (guanine966-N2)-methyltransferase
VWLDLFAGTGAVGIEALSRGAKECLLRGDRRACGKPDRDGTCKAWGSRKDTEFCERILPGVLWRLQREHVAADVVFLDPPYRMQEAYQQTLVALADSSLVWAMSLVIAEHEKKFDPGGEFGSLRRTRTLVQGNAALSFYRIGGKSRSDQVSPSYVAAARLHEQFAVQPGDGMLHLLQIVLHHVESVNAAFEFARKIRKQGATLAYSKCSNFDTM